MTLTLKFAGFNYVADVNGSYIDANSLANMVSLTDSNAVAFTDDYGIDASTSTIYADYTDLETFNGVPTLEVGNTETIPDLTGMIKQAESAGLSVMVRPLIDFTYWATPADLSGGYYNGEWRHDYVPSNISAFFSSYDSMILAQASAAVAGGAQILDIGTEIDQLTGSQYLSQWTTLINEVKNVIKGTDIKLTYSAISSDANASKVGDLATAVSFWSQLDYVGVDEYEPIFGTTGTGDPTLQQLIDGWEDAPPPDSSVATLTGGVSLIQYYENLAAATGKPLLFTEIGYNSAPDAASQPFYTSSNTYDPTLQQNLYTAFFDAWEADGNKSLQGVYIWDWEPDPTTVGAGIYPSWTPQDNTGALEAVDTGFSQTESAACYVAGTRIATPDGERAIETLAIGDHVLTASGEARPVRWIGRRGYAGRFLAGNPRLLPILIRADAIADGSPRRDLMVSPLHALYLDGLLVPAHLLVNGLSIVQVGSLAALEYWHVELDSHDILLAEGAAAESFVDDCSRNLFQNAADYARLYPDAPAGPARYCAPRLEAGEAAADLRRRLAARAERQLPAGPLDGRVDTADGQCVTGWAFDAARPHAPVLLELLDHDTLIGEVLADRYRPDLAQAGIGSGHCSFVFTFHDAPAVRCIRARRKSDGANVPSAPIVWRRQAEDFPVSRLA